MAEPKTIPTRVSVDQFLKGITDENKRSDCYKLLEIMRWATKAEPRMWGTRIVGFGKYHSIHGIEGDWFITGFSPQKQSITLYINGGLDRFTDLMKHLGKYSTGKNCLHIDRLEDVDINILKKLLSQSVKQASRGGK